MKKIKYQYLVVLGVLSVLLIFLDNFGGLGFVRTGAQTVLTPLGYVTYSVKNYFDDSFSFWTFWKSGEIRIKYLEQRNLELLVEANRKKALDAENEELKKQLGVGGPLAQMKRIPAEVLGVSRYMTINRGKKDGLSVGQSVIYLDNFVGQIVRTDSYVSFVQMPTDSELTIPVKIGPSGEIRGVTLGQFNSSIILDQVAQNEEIKNDDLVFTSGDEGIFAPDLLIGKVGKITSTKTELFQKAIVQPFITYGKLKRVFVLINK